VIVVVTLSVDSGSDRGSGRSSSVDSLDGQLS